jgi:hypothetical protein
MTAKYIIFEVDELKNLLYAGNLERGAGDTGELNNKVGYQRVTKFIPK